MLLSVLVIPEVVAAAGSPVGNWRSIDDKSGAQRSIIRITEEAGEFRGVVVSIFPQPGDDPVPLCRECKGARKDQPVVGMLILWGMHESAAGWSGGEILDPENGNVYRCSLTLSADGKTLKVHGYIGISLFGRSQDWLKEE